MDQLHLLQLIILLKKWKQLILFGFLYCEMIFFFSLSGFKFNSKDGDKL